MNIHNKERDILNIKELRITIKNPNINENMKIIFTKKNKNKTHCHFSNYSIKNHKGSEFMSEFNRYIKPAVEKVVPDYVKELIIT